jgi:hypothetical protein
MKALIPHMSDMLDGTFRPEIVIDDGKGGDIIFFEPVADADAAWERACDEIEKLSPGEWSYDGRRYACVEPVVAEANPRKAALRRKVDLAIAKTLKAMERYHAEA